MRLAVATAISQAASQQYQRFHFKSGVQGSQRGMREGRFSREIHDFKAYLMLVSYFTVQTQVPGTSGSAVTARVNIRTVGLAHLLFLLLELHFALMVVKAEGLCLYVGMWGKRLFTQMLCPQRMSLKRARP